MINTSFFSIITLISQFIKAKAYSIYMFLEIDKQISLILNLILSTKYIVSICTYFI
jgi:hypothetical protein